MPPSFRVSPLSLFFKQTGADLFLLFTEFFVVVVVVVVVVESTSSSSSLPSLPSFSDRAWTLPVFR